MNTPVSDTPLEFLSRLVPRLIDRTRRQVELVVALVDRLGCFDDPAAHSTVPDDDRLADVVPIERAARPAAAQVIEVTILDDDDAPTPVKRATTSKKAPAKKTATKKAPAAKKATPAKKAAAKKTVAKKTVAKKTAALKPTTAEASLAIPDYDALAASQVIPRLDGLSPAELDAVRRYELAHRGRRTILGRVAQIQAT